MSSNQKSFVFAGIMCVVCSLVLTGAAVGLKPLQDANIRIDQQKNILKALGLLEPKATKSAISRRYERVVIERSVSTDGQLATFDGETLPIYIVADEQGQIARYAIPFKAYGLWSWIYGYLAFSGDANTIVGMSVYQHGETPGLGGEVEKAWFQDQFVGKKIVNSTGELVSIGIVKGKVADLIAEDQRQHYVDGISGSTLTSQGMQKYLKEVLEQYEAFAKSLRRNGAV